MYCFLNWSNIAVYMYNCVHVCTVVVHGIIHVCMLIYSISDVVFLMQVPMEVMEKKMNWPMWLVYQLRNVIKFMNDLNGRVSDVEELCNETLEVSVYMYIQCSRYIVDTIGTI